MSGWSLDDRVGGPLGPSVSEIALDSLLQIYIYVIALAVGVICFIDHVRGRVDALSVRNISLLGFLVFMVLSAKGGLEFVPGSSYNLSDPTNTVRDWLLWCTLFLIVFFAAYRIGFGTAGLARKLPVPRASIGPTSVWPLALLLLFAAGVLRLVPIPLVSALASLTAVGLAAVAAGLAGWVWAPRLFNPAIALPAIAVVGAAAFIANYGEFGRRPLVGVGAGLVWGMYYSAFRYKSLPGMASRVALVAIPPVILLGLYSSVRNWQKIGSTAIIKEMFTEGDATSTIEELDSQDTARIGQWLSEYVDRGAYETRFLFSIQYFFMYPVPRDLFEIVGATKPWPISTQMADLSNRQGVKLGNTGVTNPAGVIGNALAEGGFIAVVVYAAVLAALFRFGDEYIRRAPHAPFLVLPVGSSLGQVLGIARGETPVFTFAFIWTTATVTIAMIVASSIIARVFPQFAVGDGGEPGALPGDDPWDEDPYADSNGYAPDESSYDEFGWYDETADRDEGGADNRGLPSPN